jgi:hypothetical protein
MHRIQSELLSQECLGESSTRMSDLLGSPRVAPLVSLFVNYFFAVIIIIIIIIIFLRL